jgi:phenylacetate-CoA ligase
MLSWLKKAYWTGFTAWHTRRESTLPYQPLTDILDIQNRRFRAIVQHAYATVPYYREVMQARGLRPQDFQTVHDLDQLPLITKEHLAQAPERFYSSRYTERSSLRLQSSGTAGHIKRLCYDPAALFQALAHGHRQRTVLAACVGRTFGYREMHVVRPENVGVQLRQFYETHSWTPDGVDLQRALLSPTDSFTTNIAQLHTFQPAVLRGYGSYIGALFRHAWEYKVSLFRPKAIVYGADQMATADRLRKD